MEFVISGNLIAPVDYGPTGVEAAAANNPNPGYCSVNRKLTDYIDPDFVRFIDCNAIDSSKRYHGFTMIGFLSSNEVCKVEEKSCGYQHEKIHRCWR